MTTAEILLWLSLIVSVAYIFVIVWSIDRYVYLEYFSPSDVRHYASLPHASSDGRRVVVLLECRDERPSDSTIESLVNQSVRVADLAVETNFPYAVPDRLSTIVTIHPIGTTPLRETDRDTLVVPIQNGVVYDYDYVERLVRS